MKDDKYIDDLFKQHEEGFNKPPSSDAWNKLNDQLHTPLKIDNRKNRRWYITVAASVLIVSGFFLANNQFSKKMEVENLAHDVKVKAPEPEVQQSVNSEASYSEAESSSLDNKQVTEERVEEISSILNDKKQNEINNGSVKSDISTPNQNTKRKADDQIIEKATSSRAVTTNVDRSANLDHSDAEIQKLESEPTMAAEDVAAPQAIKHTFEEKIEEEELAFEHAGGIANNQSYNTAKKNKQLETTDDLFLNENIERLSGTWSFSTSEVQSAEEAFQIRSDGNNIEQKKDAYYNTGNSAWTISINNNIANIDFGSDPSFDVDRMSVELSQLNKNLLSGSTLLKRKEYNFSFLFISENDLQVTFQKNNEEHKLYYFKRNTQ